METMDQNRTPETWCLEGTYSEQDLRAFAAFLARRVAGSSLWALGVFVLMPLLWSGDIRRSWPLMVPIALVLVGFILLLRFILLPSKLYKSATKLPGVFEPRQITIDAEDVHNVSSAGSHHLRLQDVQEVVTAPAHLFVMVAQKQGMPIPKAWIGDETQVGALVRHLQSRRLPH
jgi:hypothetical protein